MLLVCAVLAGILGGCAPEPWFRQLTRVEVGVAESSNRGTAVAVDVVCVYEAALLDSLGSTPARQWFQGKRDRLQRQFPDGFHRWHWEWASGQIVDPKIITMPARTEGVFIYASYRGRNPYRERVARLRDIELVLGETSFRARPAP